ncbi:hypothetical protein L0F51_09630 [Afifella sp. H1R]|uniref:hypothetical protein n=1 Tax=Afifella sp. H1R TaxID=2908841 RepID=UPI001F24334D|nr:hypothetical protein [Afifella sp. H1R]MCF1504022.1 hypothetical protein [Afifella sp. H1R]
MKFLPRGRLEPRRFGRSRISRLRHHTKVNSVELQPTQQDLHNTRLYPFTSNHRREPLDAVRRQSHYSLASDEAIPSANADPHDGFEMTNRLFKCILCILGGFSWIASPYGPLFFVFSSILIAPALAFSSTDNHTTPEHHSIPIIVDIFVSILLITSIIYFVNATQSNLVINYLYNSSCILFPERAASSIKDAAGIIGDETTARRMYIFYNIAYVFIPCAFICLSDIPKRYYRLMRNGAKISPEGRVRRISIIFCIILSSFMIFSMPFLSNVVFPNPGDHAILDINYIYKWNMWLFIVPHLATFWGAIAFMQAFSISCWANLTVSNISNYEK